MKTIIAAFLALVALLSGSAPHCADHDNQHGKGGSGQAAFAKLQALVGEWEAPLPNNEVMKNVFRPLAFGTALAHEEWKNNEQITATVFYVVGSELRADHYCDMGNQLRYVAAPSADTNLFQFVLRDATNLDTHPRHFRSTTWQLIDADHHVQDWEVVTPGKTPKMVRMEFKRMAAAESLADPEAVVRATVHALNQGNATALLALFSADASVFDPSQDPDRLAGEPSATLASHEQRKSSFTQLLSQQPLPFVELHDIASAGDLVAAKLRFSKSLESARPSYVLALYRVRDGLIQDLWHIARVDADAVVSSREAEDVVRRFAENNNRGDVEAFLALFAPHAKNFRNSGQPHAIGDKPSVSMVDQKSRRETYLKMFANGAPAQVQTLGTVALGNMIVAREVATLPTGKVLDEISIYRIENGLIVHDWFVFIEARE
jgi:hypothetical protein